MDCIQFTVNALIKSISKINLTKGVKKFVFTTLVKASNFLLMHFTQLFDFFLIFPFFFSGLERSDSNNKYVAETCKYKLKI